MTLSQSPVNDNASVSNTVHKGQTIIVTSEINVPASSRCDVNVTFIVAQSPASVINLVVTDVVYIGRNIPCLTKQVYVANVSSWWVSDHLLRSGYAYKTQKYRKTMSKSRRFANVLFYVVPRPKQLTDHLSIKCWSLYLYFLCLAVR